MTPSTWTPERRQAASDAGPGFWELDDADRTQRLAEILTLWPLRWTAMTDERRTDFLNAWHLARHKGQMTFAERTPEGHRLRDRTWAALEDGSLVADPCQDCGAPANPLEQQGGPINDYQALAVTGWRCHACWKATHETAREAKRIARLTDDAPAN